METYEIPHRKDVSSIGVIENGALHHRNDVTHIASCLTDKSEVRNHKRHRVIMDSLSSQISIILLGFGMSRILYKQE